MGPEEAPVAAGTTDVVYCCGVALHSEELSYSHTHVLPLAPVTSTRSDPSLTVVPVLDPGVRTRVGDGRVEIEVLDLESEMTDHDPMSRREITGDGGS